MGMCNASEAIQMDSCLLVRLLLKMETHIINDRSATHLNGTEIGEPPRWTFLADPSSPYYIDEDTFYDINKTIATVTRIKSIHNCKTTYFFPRPFPYIPLQIIDTTVSQRQTCSWTGSMQTGSTQTAMSQSFPPITPLSLIGRPTSSADSTRFTVL